MNKNDNHTLLRLDNVSRQFKAPELLTAVANTSFVIHKKDMVAIIGPNGAGKSTLMAMCAGAIGSSSGQVTYADGLGITYGVAYLPEEPTAWEGLTAQEYLTHISHMHSINDVAICVDDISRQLFITEYLHQPIATLSKGTRQRVFLAAVILPNPQILILDEPTDGLDPLQQDKILTFLQELAKTRAVIVSTHQLADVTKYFNRVMVMKSGKIMADTTPKELERHGQGDINVAYRVMVANKGRAA